MGGLAVERSWLKGVMYSIITIVNNIVDLKFAKSES